MPAEMKLKEETPTKIILETGSPGLKWSSYLLVLVGPPLLLTGILLTSNFAAWLDWVLKVIAALIEMVMILLVLSELTDVTVTIDLNSQRATRAEQLFFVRIKKKALKFDQVSRVLIHCEEHGHHCRMLLDSMNSKPLELDFYLPLEEKQKESFILSKKIGSLLRKPVVVKVTDMGNLISEETIQD
jgi:hypothetical protein